MCEECMASYDFNFGTALYYMKDYKKKVSRAGWNGKGMYIYYVQTPEEKVSTDELVHEPYIALKTVDDKIVPWTASQTDLLATDWKLVDQENEK